MSDIKLVYFDIRGRGEVARLVMVAAGQQWDDARLTFQQWPAEKPNSPFGQLPYLEYKGKKYGQSNAIAGFLAREFGMYGRNNLEALRIDEVIGLGEDLLQCIVKAKFGPDEAVKAEAEKKLAAEDIPKFLGFCEKLLQENNSKGFFVGNALTLADLVVFNITDSLLKASANVLDSAPQVQQLRTKVAENPKIKSYLASRKETEM